MPSRTDVAVVTGAAGGIGQAVCRRLSSDGIDVIAVDRDGDTLAHFTSDLTRRPGTVTGVAGDVTDATLGEQLLEHARNTFGTIPTILVNNAGSGSTQQPIWKIDPDTWRRDIDVNLTSQFLLCRSLAPAMIDASYGRIVNIASAAGMEGQALAGGYAAAKGGVVALTKTLGKELAQTGVIVNAIAPALISTRMIESDWFSGEVKQQLLSRIPMGRPGTPEEVAELVAYLASDRVTFSTGAVYDLSGGRATY